MKNGTPSFIG